MDINQFKKDSQKYASNYDSNKLFDKIAKFAKKAGVKSVYMVLMLYYALVDKNMPMNDRMLVMAALGYFILPVDLIPDALPVVGFTDDATALVYALKSVWGNITPDVQRKARTRLEEWFGQVSDSELNIPGL